jgi:hypothetical protein
LYSTSSRIKTRQSFYLSLNIIPVGLRIDKEAPFFGVDGNNDLSVTVIQELIPEPRRNIDATFRINIHVVYAPEHVFKPTPYTGLQGSRAISRGSKNTPLATVEQPLPRISH